MFQTNPSLSWWTQIIPVLSGLLGTGIGSALTALFYKNKTDSEAAKNNAQADSIRLEGGIKAYEQMLRSMERFQLAEANLDERERNLQSTASWYRKQIRYYEELDKVNRSRGHDLSGELGRLVLGIRNLELKYQEETSTTLEPFPIKTYDEIVKPFPLPEPPE